jgi:hypothetical protein
MRSVGEECRLFETTKFNEFFLRCFEGFQGLEGQQGQLIRVPKALR